EVLRADPAARDFQLIACGRCHEGCVRATAACDGQHAGRLVKAHRDRQQLTRLEQGMRFLRNKTIRGATAKIGLVIWHRVE
ncbi:MAG: hypothetical protein ACK52A_13785, partial [Planctomycetota bacterium]